MDESFSAEVVHCQRSTFLCQDAFRRLTQQTASPKSCPLISNTPNPIPVILRTLHAFLICSSIYSILSSFPLWSVRVPFARRHLGRDEEDRKERKYSMRPISDKQQQRELSDAGRWSNVYSLCCTVRGASQPPVSGYDLENIFCRNRCSMRGTTSVTL